MDMVEGVATVVAVMGFWFVGLAMECLRFHVLFVVGAA